MLALAALVVATLVSGCSSDDPVERAARTSSTTSPSSTVSTTTEPGTAPTRRATAEDAVTALLDAEVRGDHAGSYRLLSKAAREEVGDVSDWTRDRNELPAITRFTTEAGKAAGQVVAIVEHEPALDPFIGLTPARERQTWTAVREDGGWLTGPAPGIEYILPPDAAAVPAVKAWATDVQACNAAGATERQAVGELYGTSANAAKLCRSRGPITVGEVGALTEGPTSADLVAQYSSDVLQWARVVETDGPAGPFSVVVAPLGDTWKVLGVTD